MIGLRLVLSITLVLGGLFNPLSAEAQEAAKIARIGYLAPDRGVDRYQAFLQGLRDHGYVEGHNVVIEYRSAEEKLDRLPTLAAELVRLKVDVIVAAATVTALAAKQATRTIPIVFPAVSDPVAAGFVAGFARPGGNITGLSFFAPELVGKSMELPKQAAPGVS
jgi:putative ABC transport system substrate-binding protein